MKMGSNALAICFLLLFTMSFAQPYETETAEDIMECYKKSRDILAKESDCNEVTMKDKDYKCCYLTKTARDGDNEAKKTCVRLFFDEDTLRDYRNRLKDEYKDISLICSERNMISFGVGLIILLSFLF